ncbi:MAG: hypothetical protein E2O69_00765, partial [Deltaproteobacteria bacterium]
MRRTTSTKSAKGAGEVCSRDLDPVAKGAEVAKGADTKRRLTKPRRNGGRAVTEGPTNDPVRVYLREMGQVS